MIESEYSIRIDCPRDYVMQLFEEQSHFKHWQRGLIGFKNLSEKLGIVGSKRNMKIKVAGAIISMTEEITKVDLPHTWEATYRTKGVVNKQSNTFEVVRCDENNYAFTEAKSIKAVPLKNGTKVNSRTTECTLWKSKTTFTFTGMMRLVARAQPKLFKDQTQQHMHDFKKFAEAKYAGTWEEN